MKKFLVFLCAIALIFSVTATANAVSISYFTDRPSWEASVTDFVETTDYPGLPYSTLLAATGIDVGYGETVAFDIDLSVREIGSGWATWSGGYTGEVLYTLGALSVTGTFSPGGLFGFGFEAEPNPFSEWMITLTLFDGTSIPQLVHGDSGAEFFGWTGTDSVKSMTISSEVDFAFGRMVAAPGVPEPATMLLLGSGLVGLAFLGRKKLFKKS